MKSFFFALRSAVSWAVVLTLGLVVIAGVFGERKATVVAPIAIVGFFVAMVRAYSHTHRVMLLADKPEEVSFGNRHRRRFEMMYPATETFDMVDATIRELPGVCDIQSVRDSLQIHARVARAAPNGRNKDSLRKLSDLDAEGYDLVRAIITPGENASSLTLVCEPERGAWSDWLLVDFGRNFENAQAIRRALKRRISERRKDEMAGMRETAEGKELAIAKLNLLHAQVEPHFLYNTLASAQLLARSDPAKADRMLGNLITYLRTSIPRTDDAMNTLGDELERAQAYLEIMRIRMGDRLAVQIEVPDALKATMLPPMMVQTLVENAIKHGLEPVPGGGTIWIRANESEGRVAVTVADDGRGFSENGGGTGIGLKNVRERLRLAYGDAASLSIVSNFPKGVAATLAVPK